MKTIIKIADICKT